ncbi:MAG: hypothetical protein NVSMB32_01790 [Actinomycetota bacterium]
MVRSSVAPEPLFDAWAGNLAGWGVPQEILAAAPTSPWGFPGKVFAQRAQIQAERRGGPSYRRADEALPVGGTLLDVGSGAGAGCLPHAAKASRITAVDSDPDMLTSLVSLATRLPDARARIDTLAGLWPEVSPHAPLADVVTCHHVFYNVAALRPFVEALTAHARVRVVVELTDHHPMEPMNPLWLRFHGLARPAGPTAEDAAGAIAALGHDVGLERWGSAPLHRYDTFEEMVGYHRRRLCLPAQADAELGAALVELGVDPDHPLGLGAGRPMVTLWWDCPGSAAEVSR